VRRLLAFPSGMRNERHESRAAKPRLLLGPRFFFLPTLLKSR